MKNLTDLFGSPTDCECQDCNSIFSPASYLVDIMQYLDHCPSNGADSKSVLQILLDRRPDIGNLLLTCENTNTEIPYIDLVNEIMEYYVVNYHSQLPAPTIPPDTNLAHDTDNATAEQLKAEPQYILMDAYKTIYQQVYPFNLPYHQPLDVIRTYLDYLKTSRAELLEVFKKYPVKDNNTPPKITLFSVPPSAIDAERMNLSLMEYEILANADFSGNPISLKPTADDYFGDPPPPYASNGISVNSLLGRTGLSYVDLLAVLETRFINPGQNALNVLQRIIAQLPSLDLQTFYNGFKDNTWQSDDPNNKFAPLLNLLNQNNILNKFKQWLTDNFPKFQQVVTLYEYKSDCDINKTFLYSIQCLYETPPKDNPNPIADANITADFLSRFHRFVRLWRKTGWTMHELDNLINNLGEPDITPSLIHKLAAVKSVNAILKLPLLTLACLWGNIDTYGDNSLNLSEQSLYAQLFLENPRTFTDSVTQSSNVFALDPLNGILTSDSAVQLTDHLPEVFAALAISADDYNAVVADAKLANLNITLENLSTLYRYKLLADTLEITIPDLCLLKSCLGSNPFNSPDETLDFLVKSQKFQSSGFSVTLLNYVLNGISKNIDNIALTPETILQSLPTLRNGLLQNSTPNSAPTDQITAFICSLINLDPATVRALITSDLAVLLNDVTETGLDAYYFNNSQFTAPADLQRIDPKIDFSWGAEAPDLTVPADKFSVRWKGWVCPPVDGDYTFTVQIAESDESAALWIDNNNVFTLNRDDFPNTQTGTSGQKTIPLTGGKFYPFKLEYVEISGNARIQLYWQSANSEQEIIGTQFLYPESQVQDFIKKITLYHRAAQFISAFKLDAAEVSYFLAHWNDFDNINFLPPTIDQWLRIEDYIELRKIIPSKLLLPVFQMAVTEAKTTPNAPPSVNLISAVASGSKPRWSEESLTYLANYFGYQAKDFTSEIALLQIKQAMDLATKTKIPLNDAGLPSWTVLETDINSSIDTLHPVAEQIKNAVKGKYKDNWLTIAAQLNNGIRENQKQALISYLLTLKLPAPDDPNNIVKDVETLYEYLLIDVEMTSTVVTSRLIQATMAVQLFADRCLLGLESKVPTASGSNNPPINADEWEWMKHYSVAAGLKKLFVYVENYLHPSLRDDKSPFFKDFEAALKKSDITDENAENAFREYLYKLNEVSNMEMCGMYHDQAAQTLHVFARTHSAPYNYYYRTAFAGALEDSWKWSAWEPVQLDIKSIDDGENSGVHLLPVIWKKRLFLFWLEFAEKTISFTDTSQNFHTFADNTTIAAATPQKYWEVRLAWSEYANSKWTPKHLSKEVLTPLNPIIGLPLKGLAPTKPRQYLLRSKIDNKNVIILTLLIRYKGQSQSEWTKSNGYQNDAVPLGKFQLTDVHEKLSVSEVLIDLPISTSAINLTNSIPAVTGVQLFNIPVSTTWEIDLDYLQQGDVIYQSDLFSPNFYEPFFQSLAKQNKLSESFTEFLSTPIKHKILFSNDVTISSFESSITYPFFYTDTVNNRTYFATPVKQASKPKIPNYPGPNQINMLKNPTAAPLYLFNQNAAVRPPQLPVGGLVSSLSSSSSSSPPLSSTSVSASKTFAPNTVSATATHKMPIIQRPPAINSFGTLVAGQSGLGQLTAPILRQNVVTDRPAFLGDIGKHLPPFFFDNYGLAFYTFYHPFTSILIKRLNYGGIPALLAADTAEFSGDGSFPYIDTDPNISANDSGTTFQQTYNPNSVRPYNSADPKRNYYIQNIDFNEYGTYSCYNWELFFHAPLLIATSLSKNGKYAEARKWFHYIFNPLAAPDASNSNAPYWEVLPFKTPPDEDILTYIAGLQPGYDINPTNPANSDNQQIDEWRADPFNAFQIARLRPLAFMKNVVMSYLDNLINWGDDLFRTYTRENINEATQLYVMAARILGTAPQYIPKRGIIQNRSYNDLNQAGLNDFGDAVVQLENMFPNSSDIQQINNSVPQNLLGIGQAAYFCVPPNDHLLQYWTKVGDRLFKIRHGQNIDGIVKPLALYQPPIDPELLLQAKAQGLDIAGILAEQLDTSPPLYRFTYLLQKAKEFCNEVVVLGGALLSANEKQDAEQLSRLRQTQEIDLLKMVTEVKTRQVLEAQVNLDNLISSRLTAFQKLSHYAKDLLGNQPPQIPATQMLSDDLDENSSLPEETIIPQITSSIDVSLTGTDEAGVKIIPKEKQEMDASEAAYEWQQGSSALEALSGIFYMFPKIEGHVSPLGVGASSAFGGVNLGSAASALAKVAQMVSAAYSHSASQSSRMAGFIRREQDWVFQANMAAREIVQLDKQIIAAQIRLQMAQHELTNHNKQIDNANEVEQFLESKFSKQELYQWMIDKLQDAHKQGYQLAYDLATKAENAYRFELGIPNSSFVQYGYFNDTYLGITAGEQLQLALKQMDAAYLENNDRERELTKPISLALLNPLALLQLKESGACTFDLPEVLFDMDYPGHYFRRIKSVSLSIPCVAGPYTTVNSTLRLLTNSIRVNTATDNGYPHNANGGVPTDDNRFIENNISFTAISTSFAQNDSGVFELNFRDERYLPFEGAGTISSWQLELNGKYLINGAITDFSQFDYDTINDVIIHVKYTARELKDQIAADDFRQQAISNLPAKSLVKLFSLRHDFPTEWSLFLNQPDPNTGDQTCKLQIDTNRFPFFVSKYNPTITNITLYADAAAPLPPFQITSPTNASSAFAFTTADSSFGTLQVGDSTATQVWGNNNLGLWKFVKMGNPPLSANDIQDIYIVVSYDLE